MLCFVFSVIDNHCSLYPLNYLSDSFPHPIFHLSPLQTVDAVSVVDDTVSQVDSLVENDILGNVLADRFS